MKRGLRLMGLSKMRGPVLGGSVEKESNVSKDVKTFGGP